MMVRVGAMLDVEDELELLQPDITAVASKAVSAIENFMMGVTGE